MLLIQQRPALLFGGGPVLLLGHSQATGQTRKLALTSLETTVGLVDDIRPSAAANNAAIAVTVFQRLEAVADLHGSNFQK